MTSQKDLASTDAGKRGVLPPTDAGKRGISLLTDNTAHWSYRKRTAPPERITMDVRESEVFGDSDEMTLPSGTPVRREATVEISAADIEYAASELSAQREPILPQQPAAAEVQKESSMVLDLRDLIASAQGKPSSPPAKPDEPARQSSVMFSLKQLSVIEDQRVAGEKEEECSAQLKKFEERLATLKGDYRKTKASYEEWGIEIDPVLEDNIAALRAKYAEIEGTLGTARASIKLMPDEEGYKDGKTLHGEFDWIAREISGAIWSIGAGELQNRTLLVTLETRKKENEQIELEETESGPKIARLTKYYREEGECYVIGSGYLLELIKIGKDSCTFSLQSKADEYEKSFRLAAGKEWSDTVSDGMKVVIECEGPTESGSYKAKIAVVTERKAPSEESLNRGVDELIGSAPAREPSLEIDVDLEAPDAVKAEAPAKPRGKFMGTILGIGRWFGGKKAASEEKPVAAEPGTQSSGDSGATQEVSLSDVELEEPDEVASGEMGIPWGEEHSEIRLSKHEVAICDGVLEEGKLYWIIPAPQTENAGLIDLQLVNKFKDDAIVRLKGKSYVIFEGEDGFADARRIARVGKTLHVWPHAMTSYEFLGSISTSLSAEYKIKEVEWPENFSFFNMSLEECAKCNYFFPENKPRWLHPVPDTDTMNEKDRLILETMKGTQQITLGGRQFYVLNVNSVPEWREMALYLPKMRIASRGGEWLSAWKTEENGYYMFFNSNSSESGYFGSPLASLREKKGVKPYDSEKYDVEQLFGAMKDVWLYELDNLREIPSGQLSWIIASANSLIQKKGVSPLVSVGGRWYAALDIFIPDSFKAVYNGENVVVVQHGADHKERLAEMKRKLARKNAAGTSSIPAGPVLPDEVVQAMPEGEVKFLYYIGPENEGIALQRATVKMTMDNETHTYIIIDKYMEGVIPVERRGMKLYMAKGSFGDGPAQEDEDSIELEIDR